MKSLACVCAPLILVNLVACSGADGPSSSTDHPLTTPSAPAADDAELVAALADAIPGGVPPTPTLGVPPSGQALKGQERLDFLTFVRQDFFQIVATRSPGVAFLVEQLADTTDASHEDATLRVHLRARPVEPATLQAYDFRDTPVARWIASGQLGEPVLEGDFVRTGTTWTHESLSIGHVAYVSGGRLVPGGSLGE